MILTQSMRSSTWQKRFLVSELFPEHWNQYKNYKIKTKTEICQSSRMLWMAEQQFIVYAI